MEFLEFPKMVYAPDGVGVIVQNDDEEAAFLAKVANHPAEVNRAAPIAHVVVHEPVSEPEPATEPASVPNAAAEAPEAPAEITAEERREAKNKKARELRAAKKAREE